MASRDEIRAKVARLMAMGRDDRTNENEAEAALRQAAAMMRKHGIDASEIPTGKAEHDWVRENVSSDSSAPFTQRPHTWFGMLSHGIAAFTDTSAVWVRFPHGGKAVQFRGEAIDVEYAVWLAKYLRDEIRFRASCYAGTRAQRETFRKAMASRLQERMMEMLAERNASLRQHEGSAGNALVMLNQKIALRDEHFGKTKPRPTVYGGSVNAFGAGEKNAEEVGFGRPVESGGLYIGKD